MTIFHVPSWYPYPKIPYSGVFIKEQITAYAELNPDDKCYVSNFHQLRYAIAISRPREALQTLVLYINQKKNIIVNHSANLIEFQTKILIGNKKLVGDLFKKQQQIAVEHLLMVIKKENKKPDLIHAHVCYPAGLIAEYLSEKFDIPYIISEQSGMQTIKIAFETYKLKDKLLQCFAKANRVSALSTYHKNELIKLGVSNIDIIPNLVDETLFYPKEKKQQNDKFTFFTLSVIKESKGIKDLLLSISEVIKRNQNLTFRIGGTGPEFEILKRFSNDIGIGPHVVWLGYLNRQQSAVEFQSCDCFILPSKLESFGVVYAEAIACGKPVIATACGGPSDIITPLNGVLVEKENIAVLASSIIKMIAKKNNYDPVAIRSDFLNKFSKIKVTDKIRQFYIRAIS